MKRGDFLNVLSKSITDILIVPHRSGEELMHFYLETPTNEYHIFIFFMSHHQNNIRKD